jgi:hypothetical protein
LHLTDEAIDAMVEKKASKRFFEDARINKRHLIKNLESDGLTYEDITTEVSAKMLEWLDEYQRTGKIKTDYGETDSTEEDNEIEIDLSTEEFETFHHRSPIVENLVPELPTDETVKTVIQAIIEALTVILGQPPIDCGQAIEIIEKQIDQLVDIRQVLIDLCNRAQQKQDKEAL